jgi:hypothetical protein
MDGQGLGAQTSPLLIVPQDLGSSIEAEVIIPAVVVIQKLRFRGAL